MTESPQPPLASSPYPNRIQVLIVLLLLPALWNGLRFAESLAFWKTLQEYEASPGPLYLAVSGAIWLVCGIVLAVGVWQRRGWAWYATLVLAAVYLIWVWLDRGFLQEPHANWLFSLSVTGLCAAIVAIIMITPRTREYFRLRKELL